jgi:hypothetical protein
MNKFAILVLLTFASASSALAAQGDASRGQQDFRCLRGRDSASARIDVGALCPT